MTIVTSTPRVQPPPKEMAAWHQSLPDLVCEGFRLREPKLADAEQLAATFGPDAASTLGVGSPATIDHWIQFVAEVRTGRLARHAACFAVVRDGAPEIRGLVLLQRLAPRAGLTTASFVYRDREWETDLPALSVAGALEFAFQAVGVGRVEGRAGQARELDLVRRIGGVAEGVLRDSCLAADGFGDQTLWSVLASERAGRGNGAEIGGVRKERVPPLPDGPPAGDGEQPPEWTRQLPLLKGSLVTLREIDMADGPVLLRVLEPADLEISIEPVPKTRDDFRRYIAWVRVQRAMGRAAGFAILPRGSRHAAGLIQVRRDPASCLIAEWGIILASRHRGSGAAVEAAQLMAGFAFESVGVHRLEARTSAIDSRTVGLLRKIGAVREARLRSAFVLGDRSLDDDLWAILKPDWRATSAAADFRKRLEAISAAG